MLVQDLWRYAFFVVGRGAAAVLNDLLWGGILALALVIVYGMRWFDPWILTAVWAGTGGVAALVGGIEMRVIPRPSAAVAWWRAHRRLSLAFLTESAALAAAGQVSLYGVAAFAGQAAVGTLRAAWVLLAPVNLAQAGYYMYALPEASRRRRKPEGRLVRFCGLSSLTLASAPLIWLLVLRSLPPVWGRWLLGQNWEPAFPLTPVLTLSLVAIGLGIGAGLGLRAYEDVGTSVPTRVVQAVLAVVGPSAGAAVGGAYGAASGTACASMVAGIAWWGAFAASHRRRERGLSSSVDLADRRGPAVCLPSKPAVPPTA